MDAGLHAGGKGVLKYLTTILGTCDLLAWLWTLAWWCFGEPNYFAHNPREAIWSWNTARPNPLHCGTTPDHPNPACELQASLTTPDLRKSIFFPMNYMKFLRMGVGGGKSNSMRLVWKSFMHELFDNNIVALKVSGFFGLLVWIVVATWYYIFENTNTDCTLNRGGKEKCNVYCPTWEGSERCKLGLYNGLIVRPVTRIAW